MNRVVVTLGASSTRPRSAVATSDILGVCHSFEVVGIHAVADTARVVEFETPIEWSVDGFVEHFVRQDISVTVAVSGIAVVCSSGPQPACVRLVNL